MFWLKKLLGALLMPFPVLVLTLGTGVALLWFTRRQRVGRILVTAGLALFVLAALDPVAQVALEGLEETHAPVLPAGRLDPGDERMRRVRFVVVLGAGHSEREGLPAIAQLNGAALARVAEGVRLQRLLPGTRLVLSGAAMAGEALSQAQAGARAAVELGVAREDLVLATAPRDTEEEARAIAPIVGEEPFLLVTSASHLPRAVKLFRKVGLDPIPAPADFAGDERPGFQPNDLLPRAGNLAKLDRAWHEILGTIWSRLRGRI